MEDILHNTLKLLDGKLIAIKRNSQSGMYELEIGIPKNWVLKSTDLIDYEILEKKEVGSIIRIFGTDDDVIIDDLVEFVNIIIKTNNEIAKMEEEYNKQIEEEKIELEQKFLNHQNNIDKLKQSSFKSFDIEDDDDDNDSNEDDTNKKTEVVKPQNTKKNTTKNSTKEINNDKLLNHLSS